MTRDIARRRGASEVEERIPDNRNDSSSRKRYLCPACRAKRNAIKGGEHIASESESAVKTT